MKEIKLLEKQEIVVIGDVHECEEHYNEMSEIIGDRILVSVGDIYNKGAGIHVANSITRKIIKRHENGNGYIVRGNHEHKHILRDRELSDELKWFATQPFFLHFTWPNGYRVTIVHAGVTPNITAYNINFCADVLFVRYIDENNLMVPMVLGIDGKYKIQKKGKLWHEVYDGRFGYIVAGHYSQSDGIPKFYNYSCNIDTRCYETGILSGHIITDGRPNGIITVKK
jgi:hypothetical protein